MQAQCRATKSAPRACGIWYPVFGIQKQTSQACQATGERVSDEKIAERRVATKARKTSQSSPRVFSEVFCSTHPERGASQPTLQAPRGENATPANQLGKFPSNAMLAQHTSHVPVPHIHLATRNKAAIKKPGKPGFWREVPSTLRKD